MNNDHLDFLIRKNKGEHEMFRYKNIFIQAGFEETDLVYIALDEADLIRNKIRLTFPKIDQEDEFLSSDMSVSNSKLLSDTLDNVNLSKECYIFSDEVKYCGMFMVKTKIGIINSLKVARLSYQNICFLVGINFDFSFTINYYDDDHIDFKNMFDIQRKMKI